MSTAAATGILVLGSGCGSNKAGSVEPGGAGHSLPSDICRRFNGRTGRCLGRSGANKPDELSGGVEFLILCAQPFPFQAKQSACTRGKRELGVSRERIRRLEQDALARLGIELKDVVEATEDELAGAA